MDPRPVWIYPSTGEWFDRTIPDSRLTEYDYDDLVGSQLLPGWVP